MSGPEITVPDIGRVVIINHPKARDLAEQCVDELRGSRLGKPVVRFASRAGGAGPNAELLAGILEPGDAIGVVGGDGTLLDIADAAGSTPVTPIAGGNGHDGRRALHRPKDLPPSRIFGESVAVAVFGLSCKISEPNSVTTVHRALSYMGAGKSGIASKTINSPDYLDDPDQLRRDARIGWETLSSKYRFPAVDLATGKKRMLSELTFANGSSMAKYGKFRTVRHWDQHFRVVPVGGNRLVGCVAAARLLLGVPGGRNQQASHGFMPLEDILMHADGDPFAVPANSEVTVSLAPEPYTLLTTRLKMPR